MSNAIAKREARAARLARIEAGTCKECDNPRGINENGTPSVFCDDHRAMFRHQTARKKVRSSSAKEQKPVVRYDPELEGGYLDTRRFAEYCVKVRTVIKRLGRPTVPEMKRELGDNCIDRWMFDAIDALVGEGVIEKQWGLPERFTVTRSVRNLPTKWNRDQHMLPPATPRPDFSSIYGREATA